MVELGDLREGVLPEDVVDFASRTRRLRNIELVGLGTNLACVSGVAPDDTNMSQLAHLVEVVERTLGIELTTISGGNSASLAWALGTADVGRVNQLRLGESILLGRDPLHGRPIDGLHLDAVTLTAEVIESRPKPPKAWGTIALGAFGAVAPRVATASVHQSILAIGRQDTDPDGLHPPPGIEVLGSSSDHLVVDGRDSGLSVGDEVTFGVNYSAMLAAATSPFVSTCLIGGEGAA